MLGGNKVSVDLPYEQATLFCFQNDILKSNFKRPVFEYNGLYYRVDEICFPNKPFIVIECGTYDELLKNCMEDVDPFPCDLTDDELLAEVKYSLGMELKKENMW